jgi:hypothetical protein
MLLSGANIFYLTTHVVEWWQLHFIQQFASIFILSVLCNGRQHNAHRYSNVPSDKVHMLIVQCTVVNTVLGFYSPYLKKVLKMLSFSSQIQVTSNKHINYTSKLNELRELSGSD